ncbi:amino acid permease [bacterium]|nr:amino acid permease [bacterium]
MDKAATTAGTQKNQFGTFAGVYTPSILTILGAIMFMRANFVTGEAGIIGALSILLLAKAVSVLSVISVSAIATNMTVRGGGAYFLISRSLGPEFGGSIGLAYFLAQALSIPFYILGFTEAMAFALPQYSAWSAEIAYGAAALLLVVAWVGASWAIRVQYLVMGLLGLSVVAIFVTGGMHWSEATFMHNLAANYTLHVVPTPEGQEPHNFWSIFAIYFPAVTGFLAGVNMSGDLKDPSRSIPRGSLLAVLTGFIVYLLIILVNGGAFSREQLINQPFEIMGQMAPFGMGVLIALGVVAATLSSALGSYLGAPRILQAVARDRLLPFLNPFAAGSKKGDEPLPALALTAVITFGVLYWSYNIAQGDSFNIVASVITMFFLYTYGTLNLAAFTEAFGRNPSFRPRFKQFHWSTALVGFLACGAIAFIIDPPAAVVAVLVIGALYWYLHHRELRAAFGDARRGFIYTNVRNQLLRLRSMPADPKNWRPTILVFTGNPSTRDFLVRYANWLESSRGIVMIVNIIVGSDERSGFHHLRATKQIEAYLEHNNLPAFPIAVATDDLSIGMEMVLQTASIGPIRPNLVMLGWPSERTNLQAYTRNLKSATAKGMSLLMIRGKSLPPQMGQRSIDVWWRGRQNGSLMLLLAHMLQHSIGWTSARIRILRVVPREVEKEPALTDLRNIMEEARVEAEPVVIVTEASFREVLQQHSMQATTVLLGFATPEPEESQAWRDMYEELLEGMPTTLMVQALDEEDKALLG